MVEYIYIVCNLSARAAIHLYWSIYSTCPISPKNHLFVTRFVKGLSKTKPRSSVKKVYAINYTEIESAIKSICNGILYENLTLLDQRFIAFIIIMYSSFARYEEVRELKINDVYLIGHDFSLTLPHFCFAGIF